MCLLLQHYSNWQRSVRELLLWRIKEKAVRASNVGRETDRQRERQSLVQLKKKNKKQGSFRHPGFCDVTVQHRRVCESSSQDQPPVLSRTDHKGLEVRLVVVVRFLLNSVTASDMNSAEQTVTWLISLGVLESPKKSISDPEAFLQTSLKDGVVLCRLLDKLRPGTVKVSVRDDIVGEIKRSSEW